MCFHLPLYHARMPIFTQKRWIRRKKWVSSLHRSRAVPVADASLETPLVRLHNILSSITPHSEEKSHTTVVILSHHLHSPCRFWSFECSTGRLPRFETVLNICGWSVMSNISMHMNWETLSTRSIRDLGRRSRWYGSSVDISLCLSEKSFLSTTQCSSQVSFPAPKRLQALTDPPFRYLRRLSLHSHPAQWSEFRPGPCSNPERYSQNPSLQKYVSWPVRKGMTSTFHVEQNMVGTGIVSPKWVTTSTAFSLIWLKEGRCWINKSWNLRGDTKPASNSFPSSIHIILHSCQWKKYSGGAWKQAKLTNATLPEIPEATVYCGTAPFSTNHIHLRPTSPTRSGATSPQCSWNGNPAKYRRCCKATFVESRNIVRPPGWAYGIASGPMAYHYTHGLQGQLKLMFAVAILIQARTRGGFSRNPCNWSAVSWFDRRDQRRNQRRDRKSVV